MRFFADGPDIPDCLISDRDSGNVVFLCGAGVSQPAGLPSFSQLTEQVVSSLNVPIGARSRTILTDFAKIEAAPPYDQVFDSLNEEYGAPRLGEEIVKALATSDQPDLAYHGIVLRLSRDSAGFVQLVTTNFDNLFELAEPGVDAIVPPRFPDLAAGDRLGGLVYLHGKLQKEKKAQNIVLRASDFGRAYLADGWATRFLRELITHRTVVLVGYSANDPPIRYLLQGLNAHPNRASSRIYAFDQGDDSEVAARWTDRGVTSIAYSASGTGHSSLWLTLEAWANQAANPEAWTSSLIARARRGPQAMEAHERGQVATLVATPDGARAFANARPPLPAEWLCVFDRQTRFAKPTRLSFSDTGEFDPLATYRLDDDPERPAEGGRQTGPVGRDLLAASPLDHRPGARTRIAGIAVEWADPLSPRLFAIAQWIAGSIADPKVGWWASRQSALHPRLMWLLDIEVGKAWADLPAAARDFWSLLLERFRDVPPEQHDDGWYALQARIGREGWTRSTVRALSRTIKPSIRVADRIFASAPPSGWGERDQVAGFEVHFPGHNHGELAIPQDKLVTVVGHVTDALKIGSEMLGDVGQRFWRTNSFHPDHDYGHQHYDGGDAFLLWYRKLFDRLAIEQPSDARREIASWPLDDRFFFGKLALYAAGLNLLPGNQAADLLLEVPDEQFWESYSHRELLFSLRARWPDFEEGHRLRLEARLLAGRPFWDREPTEERQRFKVGEVVSALGWLAREGCVLSAPTAAELQALREGLPDWRPEWDANAAQSFDGRSGIVVPVEDAACFDGLSLGAIIPAATENTGRGGFGEFRSYEPFNGLVRANPFRALAALAFEGRRGAYPAPFWRALLSHWPEAPVRAQWLAAERIARLPAQVVDVVSHYSTRWLQAHLPSLAKLDEGRALAIWDRALDGLLRADAAALAGAIVHEGEPRPPTFDDAINAPLGHLTEALTTTLDVRAIEVGGGIPTRFRKRFERLLAAQGTPGAHVAARLGQQLRWLWTLDPAWTQAAIVPMFYADHPFAASAWDGLLAGNHVPPPGLFALLKSAFRAMLLREAEGDLRATRERALHQWMIIATYWGMENECYLARAEATEILRATDAAGRAAAASMLATIVEQSTEGWEGFVRPFLRHDWPKELRLRSREVGAALMRVIEATGPDFPDAVDVIVPFLLPLERPDLFLYRYARKENEEGATLTRRFPIAALTLLDAVTGNSAEHAPYELRETLEELADAMPGARQDSRWRRLFALTV